MGFNNVRHPANTMEDMKKLLLGYRIHRRQNRAALKSLLESCLAIFAEPGTQQRGSGEVCDSESLADEIRAVLPLLFDAIERRRDDSSRNSATLVGLGAPL
jgi:hypothetical protein